MTAEDFISRAQYETIMKALEQKADFEVRSTNQTNKRTTSVIIKRGKFYHNINDSYMVSVGAHHNTGGFSYGLRRKEAIERWATYQKLVTDVASWLGCAGVELETDDQVRMEI